MHKRHISGAALTVLLAALGSAALVSNAAAWKPFEVFVLLLLIAVVSDAFPLEFRQIRITGSFLAIVLAATLLGPTPAVVIGASTVLADTIRTRPPLMRGLVNLATYSTPWSRGSWRASSRPWWSRPGSTSPRSCSACSWWRSRSTSS
jgi:hypothetical protein